MAHCRIYTNQDLAEHQSITLSDDLGHYLRHVMRLHEGDAVTLFNGQGGEYQASIDQLSKQLSSCYTEQFHDISRELSLPIHIVQCANKSEKIESVLQKATELGAASFQIANSQRTALKLTGLKLEKRLQRWQRIIIEAAEQSERTYIPTLHWRNRLSDVQCLGQSFALHPHQAKPWTKVRDALSKASAITFAIGPEGGWSHEDLSVLQSTGFQTLSFGSRIMRTETAAPALLAATQGLLG
ncbi:MAG: 16S rRNA (uracil(1498)-N(3))-methyltransferase [Proteobacteria bacterium]|nr:MAG: 16S rRNA (uracil(1498)-N(3))-methyltransferase [Pseudomonadota bacterium]